MSYQITVFFTLSFSLLLAFRCFGDNKVKEENGLLILDEDNFNATLATSNGMLVNFYAPWCRHSKALAPEFAKAAILLKKSNSVIKLATVDATKNLALTQRFSVSGYPTMKFIKGDLIAEYSAGREAEQIIDWLNYKKLESTRPIETDAELQAFIQSEDSVAVGFFKDPAGINAKKFKDAAFAKLDRFPCGVVSAQEVMSAQNVQKDAIIIYKKMDDEKLWFHGPFEIAEIAKFVKNNKLPLLNEYSFKKSSELFDGDVKKHLILFVDKSKPKELEAALAELRPASKKFRNEALFIYADCNEENDKLMRFFDLSAADCPAVRFIDIEDGMAKYKMDSKAITSAAVIDFVDSYLNGKLQRHMMSQELPKDWDKQPVNVLVGKNFDDVVHDQSKIVFVMFYAPWCKHSKQLAPIWEKLAQALKDNEKIIIAKIDGTANEIDNMPVDSYPTLKYFPANSSEVLEYSGVHTIESLKYFAENGKMPNRFVVPAPPGFPKGARIEVVMSPVMVGNATDMNETQPGDKKEEDKKEDKEDKKEDKEDKKEDKEDKKEEKNEDKKEDKKEEKKEDMKEDKKEESSNAESKRKPVEHKEEL